MSLYFFNQISELGSFNVLSLKIRLPNVLYVLVYPLFSDELSGETFFIYENIRFSWVIWTRISILSCL